ncbi:MAG: class III extradiol ring-cleavage dioxygenase [Cyanobacteria bacterium J06642_2]
MTALPSVFVSHGSPDLVLHDCPARHFLQALPAQLDRLPAAILTISAHWNTRQPAVSVAVEMTALHDFYGFPKELNRLEYHAPGAPALAARVRALLDDAGIESDAVERSQLDHGAWAPLLLMYPDGQIPIAQLSIQPRASLEHHMQVGRAIASLRQENVLILASGSVTHNLGAFGAYGINSPPPDWVKEFDDWLADAIARNDLEALSNYRQLAPYARQNHPTQEHLLPLFVALGAGGLQVAGRQIHSSFTYGAFSMAAYAFA